MLPLLSATALTLVIMVALRELIGLRKAIICVLAVLLTAGVTVGTLLAVKWSSERRAVVSYIEKGRV